MMSSRTMDGMLSKARTNYTLHELCSEGFVPEALDLLNSLSDIDANRQLFHQNKAGDGWLSLHHALWFGVTSHHSLVSTMLRRAQSRMPWDTEAPNLSKIQATDGGATALHFAAHGCNDTAVFKLLIRANPAALTCTATSGYGADSPPMLPIEYLHKSYMQGRSNLADIVKLLRRCTDAMRASVPDLDLVKKLTISEEDVHIRLTVLLCFKHVRSHIDWAVEWSGLSEDEVLARLARDEESYTPSSATLKLREINKQATSFPSPNMFFKYYLKNADVFEHILKFLT